MRSGVRSARPRLVVHLALGQDGPASAGFVVSRQVGNAVVRNRVTRRLRHLMAARITACPEGSRVVVRALPASADATSVDLGADLDQALAGALRRAERRSTGTRQEVTT